MKPTSLPSLIVAAAVVGIVLSACASLGRASAAPHLSGTYSARLMVTGRSTYTGTFTVAQWTSDSVFGSLRLVSPLSVDMSIRGTQAGDTLRLRGSYTAANGCTGTMESPLVVASDVGRATGAFTLVDNCAGPLRGTMELSR
jgi:hypothetical protein